MSPKNNLNFKLVKDAYRQNIDRCEWHPYLNSIRQQQLQYRHLAQALAFL